MLLSSYDLPVAGSFQNLTGGKNRDDPFRDLTVLTLIDISPNSGLCSSGMELPEADDFHRTAVTKFIRDNIEQCIENLTQIHLGESGFLCKFIDQLFFIQIPHLRSWIRLL